MISPTTSSNNAVIYNKNRLAIAFFIKLPSLQVAFGVQETSAKERRCALNSVK
jgi:hypothetical protein